MKFIEVKTERRPDGVVTCTIWNEAGYITFVRNERGKLSTSARTTSFEPPGLFGRRQGGLSTNRRL